MADDTGVMNQRISMQDNRSRSCEGILIRRFIDGLGKEGVCYRDVLQARNSKAAMSAIANALRRVTI